MFKISGKAPDVLARTPPGFTGTKAALRSGRKKPPPAPKKDITSKRIIALRKQNLPIYDIAAALTKEGNRISSSMVDLILKEEGFAKLPRRRDEERPPTTKPEIAAVADASQLDLTPRRVRTKFGGLFLFLPFLAELQFNQIIGQVGRLVDW